MRIAIFDYRTGFNYSRSSISDFGSALASLRLKTLPLGRSRWGQKGDESMIETAHKKAWEQPVLTTLGDVETLTLAKNKSFGGADGYLFENQSISG